MADRTEQAFLGSGMKFPPQANKATGRFSVSSGAQSVKESIYLILMTAVGERVLAPEFGSSLSQYAFMDITLTNLTMMRNDIRRLLMQQEPRIDDINVELDAGSKDNCLIINITYTLAESNVIDNYVFPFYLRAASEGEE
ncbi:MAG: GPW/gp25 family protein [Clostridiales Family XIII bacterium]|jgi:phage baseplate assembly protein W|nr:GPW/gp25 family protein [Clostridiales Family XIII bacterium]